MKNRIPTIMERSEVARLFVKAFYVITPGELERQLAEQGCYQPAVYEPQEGYELHPAFRQGAVNG